MSSRRDRKGLWSFTSKLSKIADAAKASRTVANVKCKRKLLSAHHAFLLDPSSPSSSAPSSVTPCFPFFSSRRNLSCPELTSHTRSQYHRSDQRTASSAPHTASTSPICIHHAPHSAPVSPERMPHTDPHPEKQESNAQASSPLHADSSPLPRSASMVACRHHGEHFAYGVLWAGILLTLLCTFLCMGKEIAFVAAIAAHFFIQVALGHGELRPDEPVEKENTVGLIGYSGLLNRSATI